MKAELKEYDHVFAIEIKAETLQEAAVITRFGLNALNEIVYKSAYADKDGEFLLVASIRKSKKATSRIGK